MDIPKLSLEATQPEYRENRAMKMLSKNPNPDGSVYIFGYGSVMWKPMFSYTNSMSASLYDFERRFCIWSLLARGTPDNPGLVVGLVHAKDSVTHGK